MLPGHTVIEAPGAAPRKLLLFLHGILGTRANWRGIARRFVGARPEWGAVLADLREHGDSLDRPGPHTVAAAAADLGALDAVLDAPLRGVLGHSFGGKVAAAWAREECRRGNPLEELWLVDSAPGPRSDGRTTVQALHALETLESLPARFPQKADFVAALGARGLGDLATWLAMNLVRGDDGAYRFGPSLPAIRAMLNDYFDRDLWPFLESPPEGLRVHFVVGERSDAFGPADRERAAALAAGRPDTFLHVVADAGHWVHAEQPQAVIDLLVGRVG